MFSQKLIKKSRYEAAPQLLGHAFVKSHKTSRFQAALHRAVSRKTCRFLMVFLGLVSQGPFPSLFPHPWYSTVPFPAPTKPLKDNHPLQMPFANVPPSCRTFSHVCVAKTTVSEGAHQVSTVNVYREKQTSAKTRQKSARMINYSTISVAKECQPFCG